MSLFKKLFSRGKKDKPYAVSDLVSNMVAPDSPKISPLISEKPMYISWVGRLKQSLLSGEVKMEIFLGKCLRSKGFEPPKTLSECDKLIHEIESWR